MINVSNEFRNLVKLYVKTEIEYPQLKAVTVAQWMLETGRGSTGLFLKHSNAGGIKWRDEMLPYGVKISYQASDGVDDYVQFFGHQSFIAGYWRFIGRPPYIGWKNFISDPIGYIAFIHKCGYAGDPNYVSKIQKLLPEAEQLIKEVTETPATEVLTGLTVKTELGRVIARHLFELSPEDFDLQFTTPSKPPQNNSKRILLDPGHSEIRKGARGLNGDVQEEDLNRYQAEVLQAELQNYGFTADIYDPEGDDLTAIGAKAVGYDMFISLHLNAYSKKQHYTCAMVHAQVAKKDSIKVASQWATEISKAIPVKLFGGTEGMPQGVMAAGLSVLRAAEGTNCPVCFLSEAFFVDAMDSTEKCEEWIRLSMAAGAKVVKSYFGL